MDGSILGSLVGAKTESILLPHSTPTQGYSREQLGRYQVSKFATYDVDSFLCQINICKGKVHFEKACFRPFLENVLKSYNVEYADESTVTLFIAQDICSKNRFLS